MACNYAFPMDDRTIALLDKLQNSFGVTSTEAVLRKAIALANIAAELADDGQITLSVYGKPSLLVRLDQ